MSVWCVLLVHDDRSDDSDCLENGVGLHLRDKPFADTGGAGLHITEIYTGRHRGNTGAERTASVRSETAVFVGRLIVGRRREWCMGCVV